MPKDPISELPQDRLSLSELYDSFCRDCGKVMCEILLPGQVSNTLALKLKETSPLNLGFFDLFCLEQLNQVLSNFFTTIFGSWFFQHLRCLVGKQHFKTGHNGGGPASTGAETLVNLS